MIKSEPRIIPEDQLLKMIDTRTEYYDRVGPDGKKIRKQLLFCGGIRYRWNPNVNEKTGKKHWEVLKIDYHRDGEGELQVKVPGGCSEPGQNARQTLNAEMLTETGKMMGKAAKVIYQNVFWNRNNPNQPDHIQLFLAEKLIYRKHEPFLKTKSGSEKGECSEVKWEPITQELVNSFFPSHRAALKALVEMILNTPLYKEIEFNERDGKEMVLSLMNITF